MSVGVRAFRSMRVVDDANGSNKGQPDVPDNADLVPTVAPVHRPPMPFPLIPRMLAGEAIGEARLCVAAVRTSPLPASSAEGAGLSTPDEDPCEVQPPIPAEPAETAPGLFAASALEVSTIPSPPVAGLTPLVPAVVATELPLPAVPAGSSQAVAVQKSVGQRTILWWAGRAVTVILAAAVFWFVAMIGLIAAYRYVDPPVSALMLIRSASGYGQERTVVPLERIAPNLRRAVVVSEDTKFCIHRGFDFGEIRAAMKSGEGFGRGGSTISQQLAKNLFLWPDRSYLRKGLEVPLTVALEYLWPKWRILEIYLNVVEWGPGLYGAEAAARKYFDKPASRLTEREAALLAVALPNPLARDASDPEPMQARLATRLQGRMRSAARFPCISHEADGEAR